LLGLWIRIPPVARYLSVVIVVCCQVEVFYVELITSPEESY